MWILWRRKRGTHRKGGRKGKATQARALGLKILGKKILVFLKFCYEYIKWHISFIKFSKSLDFGDYVFELEVKHVESYAIKKNSIGFPSLIFGILFNQKNNIVCIEIK